MVYDVIVIGSGPAGYTAGLYCVRAGLIVLVLEGINYGGQLMNTVDIENYPGFPDGINGFDLMMNMRRQCEKLGCELVQETVTSVEFGKGKNNIIHRVMTASTSYEAKVVIIATGATAKRLFLPSEDKFWNHGISACAVCDGALPLFRNKPLVVIGGGDTACEEALFLSRFGSRVYMMVRGDKLRASHRMKEKIHNNPKIEVRYRTQVVDVAGDDRLRKVKVDTKDSGYEMEAAGLFYAIGHTPNTRFLHGALQTDDAGYLITQNTVTEIPGVFACGDVQDRIYRQAITAAGSGCMAALEAERYLTE